MLLPFCIFYLPVDFIFVHCLSLAVTEGKWPVLTRIPDEPIPSEEATSSKQLSMPVIVSCKVMQSHYIEGSTSSAVPAVVGSLIGLFILVIVLISLIFFLTR